MVQDQPKLLRVALSSFRNDIGEYLDVAKSSPIILTRYDREQFVLIAADQYHELEQLAKKAERYAPRTKLAKAAAKPKA